MINKPIFFEQNRVMRVYKGGKLFNGFFGGENEDGFFPEEWIASDVRAINKKMFSEKDGISKVLGTDVYFDELLDNNRRDMLGINGKLRILVKVLDSAVRLPAQAHPDKEFSKKFLNSDYGKTECWIILGTRPDAKLYFGFKDGVTEAELANCIDKSMTEKNAMENLMESIVPEKGDVYLIPAKTVHAIGAGCLILEIQEPTDFTIQPEHWCGEYKLDKKEMYLGLSKEEAIKCFDFNPVEGVKMNGKIIREETGVTVTNIVGKNETDCFVINCINLRNGFVTLNVHDSYGVYIVTEGSGELAGDNYTRKLKRGDYFFMPWCCMDKFKLSGTLECVECY